MADGTLTFWATAAGAKAKCGVPTQTEVPADAIHPRSSNYADVTFMRYIITYCKDCLYKAGMNQIGGWSARYIKRRRRVFTAVCILTPGKMEGLLQHVTVFLLLVSLGNAVNLQQKCDIGLQVGCPSEPDQNPWVSCSSVDCSVTTKNTWFIGALYKRVDCLETYGKMVKVEYQKQGELSCSLVPIQPNPDLLQAYLSSGNSTCDSSVYTTEAPAKASSSAPTTTAFATEAPTTTAVTTEAPTTAASTTATPTTTTPTATSSAATAPTTGAPATEDPTTAPPPTAGPATTAGASATAAPATAASTARVATSSAPTAVASCPERWLLFRASCFLVSDASGTYGDGWTFCRQQGGSLASVRSQEEHDFLAGVLPASVWIGLSDGASEGTFLWADSSKSSYTNFYPNEPSGSGGHPDEDCVEMRSAFDFAWNDEWCYTYNRYLCRMDV
ncbi:brevican core protein-like [Penaeus japonicus]|uniref:brevican core protein-like n=1 Tax=Penaeus japonicus TaxID=27405 RepID=UPI001C71118B|nr:brevican core protein-like [Penaeus japonicus]